ncbi:hypothetical protein [Acaryochloris marina]|uniref:hypothetical protein n=1 Tax=Acaryochloris marina TaxID=155978 RepID=UPI001BB0C3BB|nr:hypothetical protein [Acaryochloris marina]QUY46146.1 hypothetical protein I1H34_30935 [Acaryochloris marina S15]
MENVNAFKLEAGSRETSSERLRELALQSADLAYIVVQNPQASPELLEELNKQYCKGHWEQGWDYYDLDEFVPNPKYCPQVLQAITANPKTPSFDLWTLGKDFPQELASNKAFEDLEKESNISSDRISTVNALLTLDPVPQWVLNWISESIILRIDLARNKTTSVHYLETLAMDAEAEVRCRVASAVNVLNMSTSYLEALAQDSNVKVRCSVAGNPNIPAKCLEILAQDIEIEVRRLVAGNSNTPIHCLEALFQEANEDEAIRHNLASNNNISEELLFAIYDNFAYEKSDLGKVILGLSSNSSTPEVLLVMFAHHPDKKVRRGIACNPGASDSIKHILLKDTDRSVSKLAYISINNITNPTSLSHFAHEISGSW